jgi:FixJ family two-component response regulator
MKKGATDFLTKPLNYDELTIRLNKIETVKSLAKAATDLRNAMDVTEKSASGTIQEQELIISELKTICSKVQNILIDLDVPIQERIENALNLLDPLDN